MAARGCFELGRGRRLISRRSSPAGMVAVAAAHLMFDLPILQYSTKARAGIGQWTGEAVATFGLILTIIGTVRHRSEWIAPAVALYIVAAYWFTSSTSFANPAITIVRSLSDSFAGIAPGNVPGFVAAQFVGRDWGRWSAVGYLMSFDQASAPTKARRHAPAAGRIARASRRHI